MTIRLAPYPEYKDSGLPWLGEIPNHWEVRRGKSVFKCIDVRSRSGDEELLTVSAKDGVVPRREKKVTMFMAESYAGYKLCWPGDLVINSLWAWAGGLGFSRHHGIISSAYGVYRPRPEFASFWPYFDYLLRSKVYDWELHVRSKGIWVSRLQLTDESFLDMPIVLPPNDEAEDLAAFLVAASVRLNRVIRAKRRLIEFLNEQKQAIIHRAVTRGLPSTGSWQATNVRLKPSGVEWLGDIPEHWDVRRIRNAVDMRVSNVDKHTKEGELPIRLCNYVDVYKNDRITERVSFMQATATAEEIERFRLEPGDVLITKDSEAWNDIGIPALVEFTADDLICGYHLALLRPRKALLSGAYLFRALQSPAVAYQFHVAANGVTRYGLSHDAIKSVLLSVPLLPEQAAIVEYLDNATADIDATTDRTRREIALLREYRTRLIADVVTGKLNVRGVELPALDEAEAMEDLDIPEDAEKEEIGDIQEKEI